LRVLSEISPVWAVVAGSLLLSLVAQSFEPVLGRDSAFYVDNARAFVDHGAESLLDRFSWPWFSAMIGIIHHVLGLSYETSAYLLVFALTAGTCACIVRCVQEMHPRATWLAVLVVLTIPAFNEYRSEILREHGFWFFSAVSVLMMARYQVRRGGFSPVAGAIVSVFAASLFRLEALFLLAPIGCSIIWMYRAKFKGKSIQITLLVVALIVTGAILLWSLDTLEMDRTKRYLSYIDPVRFWDSLKGIASGLADSTLRFSSRELAPLIILSGFLVAILVNALKLMGVYLVPFIWSMSPQRRAAVFADNSFGVVSALAYIAILLVFFVQSRFTLDRYTALVQILLLPSMVIGLAFFRDACPRLARLLLFVAVLVGVGNVVSTSPKRTHFFVAGEWIQNHGIGLKRTYFHDARIPYYSGLGYREEDIDNEQALTSEMGRYDVFVISLTGDNPLVKEKLASGELELLAEFDNGHDRHMMVLARPDWDQ